MIANVGIRVTLTLALLLGANPALAQGPAQQDDGVRAPARIVTEPHQTAEQQRESEREEAVYEAMRIQAFAKEGTFGGLTFGMNEAQVLVLCDTVAQRLVSRAGSHLDEGERFTRISRGWQLQQRAATGLARQSQPMSDVQRDEYLDDADGLLFMMTMAPDPSLLEVIGENPEEENVMHLFLSFTADRCDARMDALGLEYITASPPSEYMQQEMLFRWRGRDFSEVFADTPLLESAAHICVASTLQRNRQLDFANAPLDARGMDGMSLLDWALECDDRAAYLALLSAGHNLSANGLFDKPPMLKAAALIDPWYVQKLLERGASTEIHSYHGQPLVAAWDAGWRAGDIATYQALRTAGASLNAAPFRDSMWSLWVATGHSQRILDHWDEFDSDPAALGRYLSASYVDAEDAEVVELKMRLERDFGVCFPVPQLIGEPTDERGFYIQPDCPARLN